MDKSSISLGMWDKIMKKSTRKKKPVHHRDQVDGESTVLEMISQMPEPDRAIGERLPTIIKENAPAILPRS